MPSPREPSGSARPATVGLVANPAAGKDIRRLVSAASSVSDMAKVGIIRRACIGAVEGGAERLVLADDRHALARRAVAGLDLPVEVLDLPLLSSGRDSQRAAARMADLGVGAVVALGGDGTQRDVATGWRRVPLVALSTGTNNVFPRHHEATVAGHAAGLVAAGTVPLAEVSHEAKVIEVHLGGELAGIALVEVAMVDASFTASRAVLSPDRLRAVVAVIAEPAAVGLSALAAAVCPVGRREPGAVVLHLALPGQHGGGAVRWPIAPGLYADVAVAGHARMGAGERMGFDGPGVLSFDGERDLVLAAGQRAELRLAEGGPRVIDVEAVMGWAVGAAVERATVDPAPVGSRSS